MSYYMRVLHEGSIVFARETENDPTTPNGAAQIEEYANILGNTGAPLEIQVFDLSPSKALTRTTINQEAQDASSTDTRATGVQGGDETDGTVLPDEH